MGNNTAIGWCDSTWNPVRGCSRVSEGCRHCYAEQQAARIVRMGKGKPTAYDGLVKLVDGEARWTGVVRLVHEHLADPLRLTRPRRIFVNSMSDLFHEDLPDEHIALVFGVMLLAAQHTYQILTKRAPRMRAWFARWSVEQCIELAARYVAPDGSRLPGPRPWNAPPSREWQSVEAWPVPWIWPGVSVEDRRHGVPRIDELRQVPATVRMLSCEPLLEDLGALDLTGIGWLIDGCESGDGARPADEAWFRSLAAQCRAPGVPYFHKQQFVDGVLCHDPADFPAGLQVQEFPR